MGPPRISRQDLKGTTSLVEYVPTIAHSEVQQYHLAHNKPNDSSKPVLMHYVLRVWVQYVHANG